MSYELRPLSLAEILDAAFRLVQTEWKTLLGLSLIAQLPMMLIAFTMPSLFDPLAGGAGLGGEMSEETMMLAGAGMAGMWLVYLLLFPLVTAAVSAAIGHFYLGRPITFKDAARAGRGVYFRLMGAYFLFGIVTIGATLLLVLGGGVIFGGGGALLAGAFGGESGLVAALGVIAGTVLFVAFFVVFFFVMAVGSLIPPIVVLESQTAMNAVSRAFSLGGTAKLRLVGIVFSAGMIVGFPVGGAQMLVGSVPVFGTLIWSAFQAIGFAFTSSVMVVLYFDYRCRAENYDLELLAAQVEAGSGLDHG